MTSGRAPRTAHARLPGRSVRAVSQASGTATATDAPVTTAASSATGTQTTPGGRLLDALAPRTLSASAVGRIVTLQHSGLLQELQGSLQIVQVAQVHFGALDLREGDQILRGLDPFHKRVLIS